MEVGGQRHAPAAISPGKTRYLLNRRLGGPQGRSGRMLKISPPPGFDTRTVQPVVSRYTDWDIPAHFHCSVQCFCTFFLLISVYVENFASSRHLVKGQTDTARDAVTCDVTSFCVCHTAT